MHYLLGLQRFATQKPVEYLKWAMQNLRVTPEMLGLPQANQQDPKKPDDDIEALLRDPKVSALEAELAALKQWRDEELSSRQQNQQRTYATQVQSIQSAISEFRSAIDDDTGQLKYPHFDAVQRHMGALMDTDPDLVKLPDGPDKLQKAYDMAVWARPDLRQSFIEQEAQKRVSEQEKRANAERAKRAAAVKPAANAATSKPRANTLDSAIETAMSKAGL
jgi:Skp family chaperone for outer membrane proteins